MYLGNQPALSYTSFAKQDFTTSATTSYTLDHPVTNENEIALFINFVRQEPTTAYTASGTSLTLTSATSASDDMYCVFLGKAVQTVNPPSGSVGSSQVAASIITGQTALGATPADTDELLISDAGTLKRVDYSYLKSANTPAFLAKLSSNQNTTDLATTKIQFDTEVFDTDNCYDNSTNYRFTPTTSGKYFVYVSCIGRANATSELTNARVFIYKNGSEEILSHFDFRNNLGFESLNYIGVVIDFNGSSDYVEFFARIDHAGTGGVRSGSYFGAYKIIE